MLHAYYIAFNGDTEDPLVNQGNAQPLHNGAAARKLARDLAELVAQEEAQNHDPFARYQIRPYNHHDHTPDRSFGLTLTGYHVLRDGEQIADIRITLNRSQRR